MKLSKLFSNGMVIGKQGKIRGVASPNETVRCELAGKEYSARAEADGSFELTLDADGYGGPYDMKVGEVVLRGVYVGRVWLCGGQSNMELTLSRTRALLDEFIKDEPRIKMFVQKNEYAFDCEEREADGEWTCAEGAALDELPAVPYFFAQAMLEERDTPIGLVCAVAGGTTAEAWLPEEIVNGFPRHAERLRQWKDAAKVKRTEEEGERRTAEWAERANESDAGLTGAEKWYGRTYDDSDWDALANITDTDGFPQHGSVWLRKKFELPEPPQGEAVLSLGRAVNCVTVYLNGDKVIEVGYQYPPCRGVIPAEAFRAGENVIAVRLVGDSGSPCFIDGKAYSLTYGQGRTAEIDLSKNWRIKTGCVMPWMEPSQWFYAEPSSVYYTMLAPVTGYSFDGVIWYQGESNLNAPGDYAELFTAFVANLRKRNRSDLPVVFTQLARYDDPEDPGNVNFCALREQQRSCLSIPGTAMADAYDCGEYNDVHPLDKRTVGRRLAREVNLISS